VDLERAIRRGFELFNERNWDVLARGFPDDFEATDHIPPDGLRTRGPYALREITEAAGDRAFADLRFEPLEIITDERPPNGANVRVRVATKGSGGSSGVPVQAEIAQLWRYEGGIPKRMDQYRTWDEACRAAGAA
jgi:hypothetical protein